MPRSSLRRVQTGLTGLLAGCVFLAACAPTFSDMQSARLAGTDRVEWTPGVSSVGFHAEGESEGLQKHAGLQITTGMANRVDVRLRYEWIGLEDDELEIGSIHVFALGPKFGLVSDRLALSLPVGAALGSEIRTGETVQVHPTLIATHALLPWLEVNGTGKLLIPVSDGDQNTLTAFNLGLGIGPDRDHWLLRPEAGILLDPGEDGSFRHVSLGFTFYTGR